MFLPFGLCTMTAPFCRDDRGPWRVTSSPTLPRPRCEPSGGPAWAHALWHLSCCMYRMCIFKSYIYIYAHTYYSISILYHRIMHIYIYISHDVYIYVIRIIKYKVLKYTCNKLTHIWIYSNHILKKGHFGDSSLLLGIGQVSRIPVWI